MLHTTLVTSSTNYFKELYKMTHGIKRHLVYKISNYIDPNIWASNAKFILKF